MGSLTALAPAKVNLFLHVGPVEADGFHPLASLVAFADVGDELTVEPAERLSLTVTGPYAGRVGAADDNLVLRALRALGEPPLKVTLDKRLPVAAGLGGGSSDAGAALKLARAALGLQVSDAELEAIAATLGADGPMCLRAVPAWAEGRGDRLTPEPRLSTLHAVLVNPGVPSPTGAVYRAYDAEPMGDADRPAPPSDWSAAAVVAWLAGQRNDLQGPAIRLAPAIGDALDAVGAAPGVCLAHMSGSGATVFGLCLTQGEAAAAAETLTRARPEWWVRAARLNPPA